MPYLVEALASLQAQTYPNLAVLVSDNGSDDGSEAYCREVAASDPRITYRRLETNIGAARNFNEVFRLTDGEYFSWAAHDDRFRPDYVALCVAALERSPVHAMFVPWLRFIDEAGRPGRVLQESAELGSVDVRERVRCFLDRHEWFMLYGVIRRSALEKTALFPRAFGADVILLWELLLHQRIGVVPEVLFEYRRYRDKEIDRVVTGLLGEDASRTQPSFLHTGLWRALWDRAGEADVPDAVRRRARSALVRWLPSGDFRDLFFSDLKVELLRGVEQRAPLRAVPAAAGMVAVRPGRALRVIRLADNIRAVGSRLRR
jgi:glycosyltransferase involved in cell wall biosynthesis